MRKKSNSLVDAGASRRTTMPRRNFFLKSLLSENAKHAYWPAVTWFVFIRAMCANLVTVFMNVLSSVGPTKTWLLAPTTSSPAFTNPDTMAPTPGELKISSTKNSKGRFNIFSWLRHLVRANKSFCKRSLPWPVTHDVSTSGAKRVAMEQNQAAWCLRYATARVALWWLVCHSGSPASGQSMQYRTSGMEFIILRRNVHVFILRAYA